jgi:hypothetical protein
MTPLLGKLSVSTGAAAGLLWWKKAQGINELGFCSLAIIPTIIPRAEGTSEPERKRS